MPWGRRTGPGDDRVGYIGLDLTASRVRGVRLAGGQARPLTLNDPDDDLRLFIALDGRTPQVGWAGYANCRRSPYAVCANFLPALGEARQWRTGRHRLTPEAALNLTLEAIRGPVTAESAAAVLALPIYLTPPQVKQVVAAAQRARLPLKGTAVGLLAVAADSAARPGRPPGPPSPAAGLVPWRRCGEAGPDSVIVIDADEFALSAAVVVIDREQVRLASAGHWPRFAARLWKDRLLNAVADRCVRLCRRDPRDCADAEQALYEHLDEALDRIRTGQPVVFSIRTDYWYQDVPQTPEEFEAHCRPLARGAAEALTELVHTTDVPAPPRAVWLTYEAGRLPGLAQALAPYTPAGTAFEYLPPEAVARAAAALTPRWLVAELPRGHLDGVIPLPPPPRPSPLA